MFCMVTFGTTKIGVTVKVNFIKHDLKNILNACGKPLHFHELDLFFKHNSLQKQIIYDILRALSAAPLRVKKLNLC